MPIELPPELNEIVVLMLQDIEFDLTKNEDGSGTFVFENNQVITVSLEHLELFNNLVRDLEKEIESGKEEISLIIYEDEDKDEDEKSEYGFGGDWWKDDETV